jgi:RNA polymerase sigma-70 factor (family 1)
LSIERIHNEALLLQQLREGSEDAFTQLYHHYSPRLYLNVHGLVKDRELSEDIVQECFLRLWRKHDTVDPSQNFAGYLVTMATNLVLNTFRKASNDQSFKQKIRATLHDEYAPVEEQLDYRQSKEHFENALSKLPQQQYKVYQLCKVEGYTYREAAALMGISQQTVKDYMSQAAHTVRTYMANHIDTSLALLAFLAIQPH